MAIGFGRMTWIGAHGAHSAVSAAAYRHRAEMLDQHDGYRADYRYKGEDLVHEELALPNDTPQWVRETIDGRTVAQASEALWNAAVQHEKRIDAQAAREIMLALPVELTREQNVALVREFVETQITSRGQIADWVYHDKEGNPHVHIMHTIRPLTEDGFGNKKIPVLDDDGNPIRVPAPGRKDGKIVYRQFAGEREDDRAIKLAWGNIQNRHLALAGVSVHVDMRSYEERGLTIPAQPHYGPERAGLMKRGGGIYDAPAEQARRMKAGDVIADDPSQLIKLVSGEHATFTRQDLAKALHRYVSEPEVFTRIMDIVEASPELVRIGSAATTVGAGGAEKTERQAVFTTREMLRIEHRMAKAVDVLMIRENFAVSDRKVRDAIHQVETRDAQRSFRFDPEQVDAVRHVTGRQAIATVVGYAGAGKSTLLDAARIAWQADGRRVFGAALAGKAAEGLQDSAGIDSRTIASWELGWKNGHGLLQKGDIFVVDEAGMVSSEQMARVIDVVRDAGAKLVLVGDAMQLQPIQAGAAFRSIADRAPPVILSGIRRQRLAWMQDATRDFASGNAERVTSALAAYADAGKIKQTETQADAIAAIVSDWSTVRSELVAEKAQRDETIRGDELLVLAHTNKAVLELNNGIRERLIADGHLAHGPKVETERGTRDFAPGDRIVFLRNAKFMDPARPDLGLQVVENGRLGTVTAATENGGEVRIDVRLDNGRDVSFTPELYRNVDHGYATTIHKAQGATVDRAFVLASPMMDQHLTYVAMSRHRHDVAMYAPVETLKEQVDYKKGLVGVLVGAGTARFSDDIDATPSPYADFRLQTGQLHRAWGAAIPDTLIEAGADVGDVVSLQVLGKETVSVTVTVRDPETGERRQEEREVLRNRWKADRVDALSEGSASTLLRAMMGRAPQRPDYASGIVGEIVASGSRPYRDEPDARQSPFVELRLDDGRSHIVWGAGVPAALEAAGVGAGDTILLRQSGRERMPVPVKMADPETGEERWEEKTIERQLWSAERVEPRVVEATTTVIDPAASEQVAKAKAPERPAVFVPLAERLSRSGAKTTTLDFEHEDAYRTAIRDFCYSHAVERSDPRSVGARLTAWIETQRDRLAETWNRLEHAIHRITRGEQMEEPQVQQDQARPVDGVVPADTTAQAPSPAEIAAAAERPRAAIPATVDHDKSVVEAARERQLASPGWIDAKSQLHAIAALVYRDPDAAVEALASSAARYRGETRGLGEQVTMRPEAFGTLRGEAGIKFDGGRNHSERATALAAVGELSAMTRNLAIAFRKEEPRFIAIEERRRKHMAIEVPALSPDTEARMRDLGSLLRNGGEDAWRQGYELLRADTGLVREVDAMNQAIVDRYGFSAFTDRADERVAALVADRTQPENREALADFAGVRRFASQLQADRTREEKQAAAIASGELRVLPLQRKGPEYDGGFVAEVVAIGRAPFRGDPQAKPSAYVDLRLEDGKDHRIWGAGAPIALTKAGVVPGDLVRLARAGKEEIVIGREQVRVEDTGEAYIKETVADRVAWSAEKLERAATLQTQGEPAAEAVPVTDAGPVVEAAPEATLLAPASAGIDTAPASVDHAPAEVPPPPLIPAIDLGTADIGALAHEAAMRHTQVVGELRDLERLAGLMVKNPDRLVADIRASIALPEPEFMQGVRARTAGPDAYGGLRGDTGWLVSKQMKAEREVAVDAGRSVIAYALHMKENYDQQVRLATAAELERRELFRIEIPGLSEAARSALLALHQAAGHDPAARDRLNENPAIAAEVRAFTDAVSRRFGQGTGAGDGMEDNMPPNVPVSEEMRDLVRAAGRNAAEERRAESQRLAEEQARTRGLDRGPRL